ncbi:MAG: cell division transport system permease protein [Parcubacteria group bacterium Gr01-1014_48]|nr:MAG: cell division transport system permease protein [Parcubacteria group bacterium Greene0416_14]TSC73934.1 MAG: cell division transport system permease protein [Parcubacteria group bacterium Gr01-1014_48]TSD00950.1 MAG: cell division transport system permease protein [Parcubacteria group bacterium Greene1014_15]TSD07901.1 MAG: cell division transport system permease protein [Parcubacteria group bacterium Greene0714_4]
MMASIKRILRAGFLAFWRNSVVSVSSVFVMTITLAVIGSIIFTQVTLQTTLAQISDKVDVNVYFVTTAEEGDILALKTALEGLPEVAGTQYVSKDTVYEDFRTRHENDSLTLQALDELEENPLGAILNIRAKETSQYASIAKFLETSDILKKNEKPIIDKINYYQNKVAIDKLTAIIVSSEKIGLFITAVLVILSILITFNTIRLAIFTSKDEIAVMRLVGASSAFSRGPFIVQGIMAGLSSGVIALALFYPITYWLAPFTTDFFSGLNLFDYYVDHFPQFFLIIMGSGIALGMISSILAVRKYLKV